MASSNQKTSQQKNPKTTNNNNKNKKNSFLACFGFFPKKKAYNNNKKKSSHGKKKKKKFSSLFKFCWPKLKVMNIIDKKKLFKFDARNEALKASHNIILEATKAHQLKKIDHHHHQYASNKAISQKSNVVHKESDDKQKRWAVNQSYCTTCHEKEQVNSKSIKPLNYDNKVTKDSLIGVLMMVAILIIMSIWGRLCAILCMSGLLYCVPLLRRHTRVVKPDHPNTDSNIDFNSESYKKKVVLEGLLQRDHKNEVGIS